MCVFVCMCVYTHTGRATFSMGWRFVNIFSCLLQFKFILTLLVMDNPLFIARFCDFDIHLVDDMFTLSTTRKNTILKNAL
jgi:hypothetical protein